mmetsp:Transcript_41297/g.62886  ORF Transcript_41297/g.62886 Transcript_41297/m.62886 type:complete len:83 (-) Transcript_41297:944-1192(-)
MQDADKVNEDLKVQSLGINQSSCKSQGIQKVVLPAFDSKQSLAKSILETQSFFQPKNYKEKHLALEQLKDRVGEMAQKRAQV